VKYCTRFEQHETSRKHYINHRNVAANHRREKTHYYKTNKSNFGKLHVLRKFWKLNGYGDTLLERREKYRYIWVNWPSKCTQILFRLACNQYSAPKPRRNTEVANPYDDGSDSDDIKPTFSLNLPTIAVSSMTQYIYTSALIWHYTEHSILYYFRPKYRHIFQGNTERI